MSAGITHGLCYTGHDPLASPTCTMPTVTGTSSACGNNSTSSPCRNATSSNSDCCEIIPVTLQPLPWRPPTGRHRFIRSMQVVVAQPADISRPITKGARPLSMLTLRCRMRSLADSQSTLPLRHSDKRAVAVIGSTQPLMSQKSTWISSSNDQAQSIHAIPDTIILTELTPRSRLLHPKHANYQTHRVTSPRDKLTYSIHTDIHQPGRENKNVSAGRSILQHLASSASIQNLPLTADTHPKEMQRQFHKHCLHYRSTPKSKTCKRWSEQTERYPGAINSQPRISYAPRSSNHRTRNSTTAHTL